MTGPIVSVEIGRSTWQGPAEEAPGRADNRDADMAECAAFSAGYEAGERDGRASGQQVRALVWDEYAPGCFFGKSECGDYSVAPSASAFHEGEIRLSDVEGNFSYFASPEAAKAAAQADYESRILAALTPAPQAEGQCLLTNDAIRAYAKEHRIYIREHGSCPDIQHGGWIHPFTLTISSDELRAMFSALSSQASCVPNTADSEAQGDLSPTDAIQAPRSEAATPTAQEAEIEPCQLLKGALFASIEPTFQSPLYCGVAVTAMTQACAAVFYVPRDWTREQIKDWLGNPQGFAHPPQPSETVAAKALEELLGFARALEKQSSKGTGGRRGGAIFARADAALRALKGGAHG
ncbi:hypothetical protein [Paracoccus pantotrophus]|uniref:hypothetical protein n=1 Tax=Paracoccus pantotrophus TaxID=82367 RepID=UPI00048CC782|nr:hypothetical protein [Paracoccus pantotrophus]